MEIHIRLARRGVTLEDIGSHNIDFQRSIKGGRLQPGATTPWIDWENCVHGAQPARSSINDAVRKLLGSVGSMLSATAIGAKLAGMLRTAGWNR